MVTDPISDFLTRIRNAQMASHAVVEIPASNTKKKLTELLHEYGFILQYKFVDEGPQGKIMIALKYDADTRKPVIRELIRISKPGLRKYVGVDNLPRVKNGLGLAIMSTSLGIISEKEARKQNVGGEVICYIS